MMHTFVLIQTPTKVLLHDMGVFPNTTNALNPNKNIAIVNITPTLPVRMRRTARPFPGFKECYFVTSTTGGVAASQVDAGDSFFISAVTPTQPEGFSTGRLTVSAGFNKPNDRKFAKPFSCDVFDGGRHENVSPVNI